LFINFLAEVVVLADSGTSSYTFFGWGFVDFFGKSSLGFFAVSGFLTGSFTGSGFGSFFL
jgi:hypothetical protein